MVAYHRYGHPLGHSVISAASPETKQLARTLLKQVRRHVPLEQLQAMFMSLLDLRPPREIDSLLIGVLITRPRLQMARGGVRG